MMHRIAEIDTLSHVLMVGHSLPYQYTLTKSRGHLAWNRGQQPLFLGLWLSSLVLSVLDGRSAPRLFPKELS